MKRLLFAFLFTAACNSASSSGVSSQGVVGSENDAAPPQATGEIACGSTTCGEKQLCYTVCNDPPVCLDAPSGFEDGCEKIFQSMLCTAGGSCSPLTRMATCGCAQP